MGLKKRDRNNKEVIIRAKQLDAATCRDFKGTLDEDGKCIISARQDPHDPDALILKRVNYRRPDEDRGQEEY